MNVEDEDRIRDWLKEHDNQLFADAVMVKSALLRCERSLKLEKIGFKRFLRLRRECCEWWRVYRTLRFSDRIDMSSDEWDAIRAWSFKNRELIRKADSVKFAARLMRAHGLAVNENVLLGSLAFITVWNQEHDVKLNYEGRYPV